MISSINTEVSLFNVLPKAAEAFGAVYAFTSLLNLSEIPLARATFTAQVSVISSLFDFVTSQFTHLNEMRKLSANYKKNSEKLAKINSNPFQHFQIDFNQAFFEKEHLTEKTDIALYYKVAQMVISLAIACFTDMAVAPLVNSTLTAAVAYLPNSALALCSSLSITPIGLAVAIIGIVGLFINQHQQKQLQLQKEKTFKLPDELELLFKEIENDQQALDTHESELAKTKKPIKDAKDNGYPHLIKYLIKSRDITGLKGQLAINCGEKIEKLKQKIDGECKDCLAQLKQIHNKRTNTTSISEFRQQKREPYKKLKKLTRCMEEMPKRLEKAMKLYNALSD